MQYHVLSRSPTVRAATIKCRPDRRGRGEAESQSYRSLAFVRRGAYMMHHGGETFVVEPLSAVFWAAGDEYAVSHPFGCDDCVEFRFDDEIMEEARAPMQRSRGAQRGAERNKILPIASPTHWRLTVEVERIEAGRASLLEIDETAVRLLRDVAASERARDGAETQHSGREYHARAQRTVERAKELLLSDLARNWSLKDVANEVGGSSYHLTRLFARRAGTTMHRYLTRLRLTAALGRVLQGADDLTGLALDLGFSSHSHFSAAFKSVYGRSPSSARALRGEAAMLHNASR